MKHLHLSVLLMIAVMLQPGTIEASTLWSGEIGSPVNLRQGPGLDSSVISVLKQGQKVDVVKMKNNWFMVVVDNDTYGLRGWVYGDYLIRVSDPDAHPDQPVASGPPEKPAPVKVVVETKEMLNEDTPEPEKPVTENNPSPEPQPPSARIQKTDEGTVQTNPRGAEPLPGPVSDRTAPPAPVRNQEPETDTGDQTPKPFRNPATTERAQLSLQPGKTTEALPRQALRGNDLILDRPAGGGPYAKREAVEISPLRFAGLILKFTMVIFCCVSLVLSVKAYSIVKENRRTRSSAFTYDRNLMKTDL